MTARAHHHDRRTVGVGWVCLPVAAVALLLLDVVTAPLVAGPSGALGATASATKVAAPTRAVPTRAGRGRPAVRHVAPPVVR